MADVAASAPAQKRRRGGPRDLLLSLIVLAVVLVGVVAFSQASSRPTQKVAAVDWQTTLRSLRADAPFPIWAPSAVPAGWLANHAIGTAGPAASWDLGFYVPTGDQYAAVEQSAAGTWLDSQLGAGRTQVGTVTIGGATWQSWTDSSGRPALVRDVTGSTLVVDGKASLATLTALAATLTTG